MRKHGWQLPYHPLQVVAVSVFLALGFGFYVFFAPFVGKKMYQYIVMGIYTPLIISAFGLYIWCAGADPADPGVFKSKKYLKTPNHKTGGRVKESKLGGESTSSIQDANAASVGEKPPVKNTKNQDSRTEDNVSEPEKHTPKKSSSSCFMPILALIPCALLCHCSSPNDESSELQTSEDGMFYCSLCEVEVFKYSKHCRVCDKCVDRFDHHCRNNMARVIDNDSGNSTGGGFKVKRMSAGALQAVTTLLLICAKQAMMVSKKLKSNSKLSQGAPKKIIASISSKAIKLRHRRKKAGEEDREDGVWRREILMGDKCQPLDFSGVIYYDKDGNVLSELPMRSPRASPFPGYGAYSPAKSRWTSPGRRELPSQ